MATTSFPRHHGRKPRRRYDAVSVAVTAACVASFSAVLVGMATVDTSPWALVPPAVVGLWSASHVRRR